MMHQNQKMMHVNGKMMNQISKMMHQKEKDMHQKLEMIHQKRKMMHVNRKKMHQKPDLVQFQSGLRHQKTGRLRQFGADMHVPARGIIILGFLTGRRPAGGLSCGSNILAREEWRWLADFVIGNESAPGRGVQFVRRFLQAKLRVNLRGGAGQKRAEQNGEHAAGLGQIV